MLAHLARALLGGGHVGDARAAADESVAVARRQGTAVLECHAHLVRARVYRETASGDLDRAEARAAVAAGQRLVEQTGATTYAPFLAEECARLDGADLLPVAAAYEAVGATGHAARLRADIADVPP